MGEGGSGTGGGLSPNNLNNSTMSRAPFARRSRNKLRPRNFKIDDRTAPLPASGTAHVSVVKTRGGGGREVRLDGCQVTVYRPLVLDRSAAPRLISADDHRYRELFREQLGLQRTHG